MVVRLFEPSDYGLVAMSQVVVTPLAFFNEHSFATSIVQTNHLTARRIAQVFGMLLLANVALATIQFTYTPFAAQYSGERIVADLL